MRLALAWFGLTLLAAVPAGGQVDLVTVRAAYLYNFSKYIQWPDESRGELRLCVIGNDQPDSALDGLNGKPVRNARLVVRQNVIMQDIPNCDFIFLPASAGRSVERARQIVSNYPILIVAEGAESIPKGAMVALVPTDSRLIFEIDNTNARQLGLQISSQLLRLARKVH